MAAMTTVTPRPSPVPSFTRMDESTPEQWAVIGQAVDDHPERVADGVLALLRQAAHLVDGFAVDQLTHMLQTATRAERAGADEELVVASLCHDVGKVVSTMNHPAIAAEILKPYVSDDVYWVLRVHQDFQGRHYYAHFGFDPEAREHHRGHPAFELAERFADEWDQVSFDPAYDTRPLEHFEPALRRVLSTPR
jgi:predicted HD phosphohydrolase